MAKQIQRNTQGFRKFGIHDKLAYAAGDFGCNMSFALKGTLTVFWTQYMGIDEVAMAGLLLLVQVWDAINDPLIGGIIDADRRQYKRNKFLTYIWIGSVGLLAAGALCFVPWTGAPYFVKIILFVAGYILWDAFYTIANVPYGSILPLISDDPGDRAELSTFRSVGSKAGNIVTMIALPVIIYDAANNLRGEVVFFVALIMGIIGFAAFWFMINNTEIRVKKDVALSTEPPKFHMGKALLNFFRNRPAVGATMAPIGTFIGLYGAQTSNTVMWQAYFHNAKISGLMQVIALLPMFLFMPFIRKIVSKWGKKEAITVGCTISVIGYLLLVLLPITPDKRGMILWICAMLIAGLGGGVNQCVSWSLMADAMDYSEWKFGSRDEGTIYAMHSFFRKLAQGIGPSVGLLVATYLGYEASLKANQPFHVAEAMRYQTAVFYLIGGIVQFIGLVFVYNLDKQTMEKIQTDLSAHKQHTDQQPSTQENRP